MQRHPVPFQALALPARSSVVLAQGVATEQQLQTVLVSGRRAALDPNLPTSNASVGGRRPDPCGRHRLRQRPQGPRAGAVRRHHPRTRRARHAEPARRLASAHRQAADRPFAFDDTAAATRHAVDPRRRGMPPWVVWLAQGRPPEFVQGAPVPRHLAAWLGER